MKADVEVAELDPKIEPVDAGVLAKTDEGLDTFAAAELVAKGFETAAVVIIGIGLLIGVGNKACGEASDLEDVEVNELKNEVEVTDGGFDAETEVETVVVGIGLLIGVVLAANEVKENPEAGVDATDVTAPVAIGGLLRFPKGVLLDDPPPSAIP